MIERQRRAFTLVELLVVIVGTFYCGLGDDLWDNMKEKHF
jgi:hypothetical protein